MRLSLPQIGYAVTHPYPHNTKFLLLTIFLFLTPLPILIFINIATLGYELVPSLQSEYQGNSRFTGWWGNMPLLRLMHVRTPPCEPRDLGRGDMFRLSASLFDYTVMSTWNITNTTSATELQNQERVAYRGESFTNCSVNTVRFEHSLVENTQTVAVGVICPGNEAYPVHVSMQTEMVFAWLLSKDFVGQYYGPGWIPPYGVNADLTNYRLLAFAVLQTISTDCLTVIRQPHLSNPVLSISNDFNITYDTGTLSAVITSSSLTYLNGTIPSPSWPEEANIYAESIFNLVNVAAHTVNLDLGSAGPESIYKNASVLNTTISQNTVPPGISPLDWAANSRSFNYGRIPPPYQSWAQVLRARQTIVLGTVTGLPDNSTIVTSYLCPSYQFKPIASLLTAIFIGTATMVSTAWSIWIFLTTFWAKSHEKPCLDCICPQHQRKISSKALPNAYSHTRTCSEVIDDGTSDPEKRPILLSWPSGSYSPNRLSYLGSSKVEDD